ncbi:nicotinamidase, putative [Candida dubliniensis CD36]|uniref:nicotinamidase n=1 Tax=Candida dubliniensis (strain CD36 / ATCC MYA-646 / CBS 7987 / NCPF 3949 / NRRL Y-17841) TaxID=573826 RepID=B9WJT5_CANDC|nr:nicotinamidase, putative [Candida dubliniensis CD36]CAX40866.1 nicotinamidase, putative [Candida dubliniensis CD36]
MKKTALIIVDLQEDFLPPNGSLAIKNGRSVIPKINQLLPSPDKQNSIDWSLIVATKDWHPPNHTSFASQHDNVSPFTEIEFIHPEKKLDPKTNQPIVMNQIVWPDHCVQGTKGAQLEPSFANQFEKLSEQNSNAVPHKIVEKGYLPDREYYSCFQDCWGLHHTELIDLLHEYDIENVVFVGLAYDFCVLRSAIDSVKNGFKTFVLKNYCESVYPEKINDTDKLYTDNGVIIVGSDEKVDRLFN